MYWFFGCNVEKRLWLAFLWLLRTIEMSLWACDGACALHRFLHKSVLIFKIMPGTIFGILNSKNNKMTTVVCILRIIKMDIHCFKEMLIYWIFCWHLFCGSLNAFKNIPGRLNMLFVSPSVGLIIGLYSAVVVRTDFCCSYTILSRYFCVKSRTLCPKSPNI